MAKKTREINTIEEVLQREGIVLSVPLLQELHLLTRDRQLNQDARRKLKQVMHFGRLLKPAVEDIASRHPSPVWIEFGSGNNYLGFCLFELFAKERGELLAVEARADLVQQSEARVRRLGYERVKLVHGEIRSAPLPERVHLALALHACDTATDDALMRAIGASADWIALVPCCQAELASLLAHVTAKTQVTELMCDKPLQRREFASELTNALRVLALEACGYQVTVTELVGLEHSMKNELILAKRVQRFDRKKQDQFAQVIAELGVRPKLADDLQDLIALGTQPSNTSPS